MSDVQFAAAAAHLDTRLSCVTANATPFPHAIVDTMFGDDVASEALAWFEEDADWRTISAHFYAYDVCGELTERLKETRAEALVTPDTLFTLRCHVDRIFGARLSDLTPRVECHRMRAGQEIGAHTDNPARGTETHRVVVHFGRAYGDDDGGHLVLFAPQLVESSTVVCRPTHNCAIFMEFSSHSWHYVRKVESGFRYSLVYSFRRR